jgi:hypothetical protein
LGEERRLVQHYSRESGFELVQQASLAGGFSKKFHDVWQEVCSALQSESLAVQHGTSSFVRLGACCHS